MPVGQIHGFGSIPAHTGKPSRRACKVTVPWVYPRPHGEASRRARSPGPLDGLSPPTRGSHRRRVGALRRLRSIPAHTGKPHCPAHACSPAKVYPRPHGEAVAPSTVPAHAMGLSPPTRGSPPRAHGRQLRRGSIPAHTGKPRGWGGACKVQEVYPRPHGEAASSA